MNLIELRTILEATGFPVAYFHFVESQNEPLPKPPYIIYSVAFSSNVYADNKVYKAIENVNIELYTSQKDLSAEATLQKVLNDNELPFETTEIYIESEQLYQKIYEVRMINNA